MANPGLSIGVALGAAARTGRVVARFGADSPVGALPIWIEYMREALRDSPVRERPLPPGLVNVKIDPESGMLARSGQRNAIFEYFRVEYVPQEPAGDAGPGSGGQGTDDLVKDIF